MRLLNQVITRKLAEYHEAELNQKFTPETFYQTITLANTYLKTTITHKNTINQLYTQLQQAKLNQNTQQIHNKTNQIKQHILLNHTTIIHQYIETTKNIKQENEQRTNIHNKYTLGILSYEEST